MMKKNLFMVLMLFTLFACNKEQVTNTEKTTITDSPENLATDWRSQVQTENGILKFTDRASFSAAMDYLNNATFEEAKKFGEEMNVKTQRFMLDEIMLLEEKETDKFFEPYAHLSEDEIVALNLKAPNTEEYKYALNKGLLTVEEDSREAHVYYLSVLDPTASSVINEDGFVMVGDELWQYTSTNLKFCKTCTTENTGLLKRAEKDDLEKEIYILTPDLNNDMRAMNTWSGSQSKPWEGTGESKRRARWSWVGWSSIQDNYDFTFMTTKFYIRNEAQRKRWGNWKYRSSYKPTFRWDGTWSGRAYFFFCTNDPGAPPSYNAYQFPLSSFNVPIGVTNTPMTNRTYFGNNNTAVKLHAHSDGYWPRPSNNYPPYNAGKCWEDPLDVYNISIDGRLLNGCSGSGCQLNDN